MNCSVTGTSVSEATETNCVAGTTSGDYQHFDIINLQASVPAAAYNRGWRFLKWVDSSAGDGLINCDPQDQAGDHQNPDCQFQIFGNLQTDLYFDDVMGPQDTSITSGPSGVVNQTAATFNFNAVSDPGASFVCRLDPPGPGEGTYTACGSAADKAETYMNLTTDGAYTFWVQASDPSGNVDFSPVSQSWAIDTVAPETTLTGGPAQGSTTSSTSAQFTVGSTEPGVFQCRLDGAIVWTSCPLFSNLLSRSMLGEGGRSVEVRAMDGAGNPDTTPAQRSWTVDTIDPDLEVTNPVNGSFRTTTGVTPVYTVSDATAVTVTCKYDSNPFNPCGPVSGLSQGAHVLQVRAVDAAGNETTVVVNFSVDNTAPVVSITTPRNGSTLRSTGFTPVISVSDVTQTTRSCALDSDILGPCGPVTGLGQGQHTFTVLVTDQANNQRLVSSSFRVDTVPPNTRITSKPPANTSSRSARFTFASTEPTEAKFTCKLDGKPWKACSSPKTYTSLTRGRHTLSVKASDKAGNVDGTPATYSWRVT